MSPAQVPNRVSHEEVCCGTFEQSVLRTRTRLTFVNNSPLANLNFPSHLCIINIQTMKKTLYYSAMGILSAFVLTFCAGIALMNLDVLCVGYIGSFCSMVGIGLTDFKN